MDFGLCFTFFSTLYSRYFWDSAKKMTSTTRVNAQRQHTNKKWLGSKREREREKKYRGLQKIIFMLNEALNNILQTLSFFIKKKEYFCVQDRTHGTLNDHDQRAQLRLS